MQQKVPRKEGRGGCSGSADCGVTQSLTTPDKKTQPCTCYLQMKRDCLTLELTRLPWLVSAQVSYTLVFYSILPRATCMLLCHLNAAVVFHRGCQDNHDCDVTKNGTRSVTTNQ